MGAIPSPASFLPDGSKIVNNVIKLVSVGGAILTVYKLNEFLKDYKSKNQLNKDQATTVAPAKGKLLFDLNGKPVKKANLAAIANEIQTALHPGWNVPTQKDRAIRVFKTTPFGFVKDLEDIYLQKYSITLQSDMLDKLGDVNYMKVKYDFR